MIGHPVLTAAGMCAAEARVIAAGTPTETLMERAGMGAAEAIGRFAGPMPALILCGPGNNGGDGYVIARALASRGVEVAVAALGEPVTPVAKAARAAWRGAVGLLDEAVPAALLVDALFGTGLTRGLDAAAGADLHRLADAARLRVAIDLPSGVATDSGAILSAVPDFDLTIAFGALKPAHLLQPAARHMGRIVTVDIGVACGSRLTTIEQPRLRRPGPDDHKYTRGMVTIVAGDMPGAAALAASAAARCGAGAVRLQAETATGQVPRAVIQMPGRPLDRLDDARIGAMLAGPGLPADKAGRRLLDEVLASGHALVLDAGALHLLAEEGCAVLAGLLTPAILTPHAGEFAALFGDGGGGGKVERARTAAVASAAVIVFKGPDTVVAAPDGRAAIHSASSHWLATAGTGDVLAGAIAATRAAGLEAFEAACAGVWLHKRAAELAGPVLIADDLVEALRQAYVECV